MWGIKSYPLELGVCRTLVLKAFLSPTSLYREGSQVYGCVKLTWICNFVHMVVLGCTIKIFHIVFVFSASKLPTIKACTIMKTMLTKGSR